MIAALSASANRLWIAWVQGRIPGFPDDDRALHATQAAAATRIRATHT